jgi:hypothetical protein
MTSLKLTRFIWLSIVAAVLTIALKAIAYFLTGSVGLSGRPQEDPCFSWGMNCGEPHEYSAQTPKTVRFGSTNML